MSGHINHKTPVTVPFWGFVTLAAAVVGAFWVVSSWTSEGLRENVGAIRTTLERLEGSSNDNAINVAKAQRDFTKQVGDLNVTLAKFGDKVDVLSTRVEQVDRSIDKLSGEMHTVEQQIAARPTIEIDPKLFRAELEKFGVKVVAVPVPYETKPPQPR